MADEPRPPRASAARLSLYLRSLEGWQRDGLEVVSSRDLATALGIGNAQVRKDLSYLGGLGQRGVGYRVPSLIFAIRTALGIIGERRTVVIGAGNLARALLHYRGFSERGFPIVGLFDADSEKFGLKVEGLEIYPMSALADRIHELRAELAIIAVPTEAAQEVVDAISKTRIRGVLNFTPSVLRLPPDIAIVNVDLSIQLEQLVFQVLTGSK